VISILKWWFMFCASVVGIGIAAYTGMIERLWIIDDTKLSFVILSLYILVSPYIGWLTYRVEKGFIISEKSIEWLEESSELMMRLAIMGTTLGFFILITQAFAGGTVINQQMIAEAAKGLAIIYLVTFVGVACSSAINLQVVNLKAAEYK
jgi:hypothetical protein